MTIKAIFFDLDDTLHDHMQPFSKSVQTVFPTFKATSIQTVYKNFREESDKLWPMYCQGELTIQDMRTERITRTLRNFQFPISLKKAEQFQQTYEDALNHLTLFPEVLDVIFYLKERNYQLGIITNGPTDHQNKKIELLELKQFIPKEFIFISDEVGMAKPDPAIFQYASDQIDIYPEETLYIGDTWENDVVGPIEAGWQSIWFNHRGKKRMTDHEPIAEIHSLKDLQAIL